MKKILTFDFLNLKEKKILLVIITTFFLTRIFNLNLFPVFCDEAIYIRWAQIIKSVPQLKFISLSDGKQPLFMWIMVPFLKIIKDPLLAGRSVSVFAGLISLIGIFFLNFLLFNSKRASFFATLIYIFLPYSLFFDRMALVDTLLMGLGIWVLILGIFLGRTLQLKIAILGGIVLGLALLTKSPAMFFALLLPTSGILIKRDDFKGFLKLGLLWLMVFLVGFGIYNLLRFSPEFYMIALRNKDYVFGIKEVLSHPHDPIIVHLKDIAEWFPNLFTWPILILGILGVIWGIIRRPKESLILAIWFLVPLIVQSFIAKVFNSRYLLFTIFPLIIFGGFFLDKFFNFLTIKFNRKFINLFFLFLIFLPALRYDFFLLTSPENAPLTYEMRRGYLSEWTSGWGIKEVRNYLLEILKKEKEIVVGTEGFWGTLPDGLQIYFDKEPRVKIIGVGLGLNEVPSSLKEAVSHQTTTFLVGNQSRLGIKEGGGVELVLKIPKPVNPEGHQDYFLLYRLK